jgi:hypothetical protein
MMRKLKIFLSLNKEMKGLIIEAWLELAKGRILKWRKFSNVAYSLGEPMKETSFETKDRKILQQISQAIHIACKYTFWESECLVKAIAAMRMLEKRNIDSTLYLGTSRDEQGNLIAHAWLRSGPYYITGFEVMEKFSVVNKFGKFL